MLQSFVRRGIRSGRALVLLAAGAAAAVAAACSDSTSPRPPSNRVTVTTQAGDTVLLNVRVDGALAADNPYSDDPICGKPYDVKARVAATSQHAVVVVDARNPASGLSDAFYQSVAQAFDTLVWPTDTRNFGLPSDIDNNGKVILFYTRAVNGLTPANSNYFVGGFFIARDLFPTKDSTANGASLAACAGSNGAEIFYLLSPDPSGSINGNARDTAFIRRNTVATVAHEFQHLINAGRRLYVIQSAVDFEEQVWLNEGLSHVAEELNFYQSAKLSPSGQPGQSPRANFTVSGLRSAGAITAFNNFGFANFGRVSSYLPSTTTYGPYSDNDDLATRGATWSFLRYASDRAGGTDSAFFYSLVNNPDTGTVNVRGVLAARGGASSGVSLETWFRDWAVSNFAEGRAGLTVASQYTQPSWNFLDVLTATLSDGTRYNGGVYPLATLGLTNGSAQTVSLSGGESSYYTFAVPAGATATITATSGGSSLASDVRLALVQTSGANAGTVTTVDGNGTSAGTVTLQNTGAAAIGAGLVVFEATTTPSLSRTVTVSGTSITAGSSVSPTFAGAFSKSYVPQLAGPTVAALAAGRGDPVMSDAAVMRRLQRASRSVLAPKIEAARAAYRAARRSGDWRAWSRTPYVPGSLKGFVVPGRGY